MTRRSRPVHECTCVCKLSAAGGNAFNGVWSRADVEVFERGLKFYRLSWHDNDATTELPSLLLCSKLCFSISRYTVSKIGQPFSQLNRSEDSYRRSVEGRPRAWLVDTHANTHFAYYAVENSPLVLISEKLAPALQSAILTVDRQPLRLINL